MWEQRRDQLVPGEQRCRGQNVALLLAILFCVIVHVACSGYGKGPAVQGQLAPDFTFRDQSGKEYSLSAFRGKVVLVNFWATWCPPCLEEMPSMEQLQRRMANQPFAILGLSVDSSWEPVNRFMQQHQLTIPVYADFDKEISTRYGTIVYPETYILDKKGRVAYKVIGPRDWLSAETLKFLDVLLAES
jgi:peroxiredoxin